MAKVTNAKTRLRCSVRAQSKKTRLGLGEPIGLGLHLATFERTEGKKPGRRFKLGDEDTSLKKAFDAYRLDSGDPSDWAVLLRILAAAIEPEIDSLINQKSAGAKKKWSYSRRLKLIYAIDRVQRSAPRKISDEEACKRLKNAADSPLHYRKAKSAKALVRQAVEGRKQVFRIAKVQGQDLPAVLAGRKISSS